MNLVHSAVAGWLAASSLAATAELTSVMPTHVARERLVTAAQQRTSTQPAADVLSGTGWNAVQVYGTPVSAELAPADRRPHLVFGPDGRMAGADGCNRLMGPYSVKANGITFGPIAGTQMACEKADEIAKRFRAALQGTSHWSIVKERLEFYGATGKPLAVFERRPAPTPDNAY